MQIFKEVLHRPYVAALPGSLTSILHNSAISSSIQESLLPERTEGVTGSNSTLVNTVNMDYYAARSCSLQSPELVKIKLDEHVHK